MKNPAIYGYNFLRVSRLRLLHYKMLKIGQIQSFEKLRLVVGKGSNVRIGSFNQNREKLFIGVYGGELSIGSRCFFNINSSITCLEKITIGDNCKFGNNLVIVDHDHNFRSKEHEFVYSPITIGNNVWVGANVTILRGTVIPDNCVIAAGSVVKGILPKGCLFVKGEIRKG